MSERKITFPVVAKGIRRNAETGVEIRSTRMDNGKTEYSVYVPNNDSKVPFDLTNACDSMYYARYYAEGRVEIMREVISEARDEAAAEDAERDYRNADMTEVEAHKATVIAEASDALLAVDTDPEIAAEVGRGERPRRAGDRRADRSMVNDACRVMGAPEPWRKDEANA